MKTLNSEAMVNEEIFLPTTMETILKAEQKIEEICAHLKVGERHIGNILIAVTEAVNNAIIHGNKNDVNKKISFSCATANNTLTFTVKDEGNGFDYDNLPDPTDPQNLEKIHGRGVFLMRNLTDQLSFEENGRLVKLTFIDYTHDE